MQLTGLLAESIWVPLATIHFAVMTGALLVGWIAVLGGPKQIDYARAYRSNTSPDG